VSPFVKDVVASGFGFTRLSPSCFSFGWGFHQLGAPADDAGFSSFRSPTDTEVRCRLQPTRRSAIAVHDDFPANGSLASVAPSRLAAQTSAIAAVRPLRRVGGGLMRRVLPRPPRRLHAAPNRSYRYRARLAQKSALRPRSGAILGGKQVPADIQGYHDRGMLEKLLHHLCRKFQASIGSRRP
jgi:hypothetical protein